MVNIILQGIQNFFPWVLRSFLIEKHFSEFFPSFSGFDQKLDSSIEKLGNVFKSVFLFSKHFGENRFAEKHTLFSVFRIGAEKELIAAEALSSKVSKLLCPCPDDIFATNSFPWITYIATICFSLWANKNFGF